MAIIDLRAWYLQKYEPIRELEKRPHDLRLNKNSLLKSGLRADFLDDRQTVQESEWFQRYLQGEAVEFYIEGSGGYAISNIDLSSHEIYFTKQEVMAHLDPSLFVSYQTEYPFAREALREAMSHTLDTLNERSRLPLALEESQRTPEAPLRLNSRLIRKIKRSLLFIADTTAIARVDAETSQLVPSPTVCIELGYALQSKRTEQILLLRYDRDDISGKIPFDLPNYQQLTYESATELSQMLPQAIETMLQRFSLLS